MQKKSAMMLRVLLDHYHGGTSEALLQPLPQDAVQQVLGQDIATGELANFFPSPSDWIAKIHYTWLTPAMETLPKELSPFVLSVLPEPHATKLGESIRTPPFGEKPAPAVQKFLLSLFASAIQKPSLLPLDFLPESPLASLTSLNRKQLLRVMDFFGIFDLAEEIRHIVDKKKLKGFYDCLGRKEQLFLMRCLHRKEKLTVPRLGLDKWDGECQKLKKLLHLRGLGRLGHALAGQHPDRVWHIAHTLDKGRGSLLIKSAGHEMAPGVPKILVKQLNRVMLFLNLKPKKIKA